VALKSIGLKVGDIS